MQNFGLQLELLRALVVGTNHGQETTVSAASLNVFVLGASGAIGMKHDNDGMISNAQDAPP